MRRSGWVPVAAQLAAPVVLGLLIGGVLAFQAGSSNNAVIPRPLGAVATPTPSFVKPASVPTRAVPLPSGHFITPPASPAPSAAGASAVPTASPAVTTGNAAGQTAAASVSGG